MKAKPESPPLHGAWQTVPLERSDDRAYPASAVRSLRNVQWDQAQGLWTPCWGADKVGSSFGSAEGPVIALHWFQPRPSIRWLIVERATSDQKSTLSWVDFRNNGAPVDFFTGRRRLPGVHVRSSFHDIGRWCVITSPYNAPIRWDGKSVRELGFSSPAPPPIIMGGDQGYERADAAGASTSAAFDRRHETRQRGVGEYPTSEDLPWRYAYCLTWIDDQGQESPPSPLVYTSGLNTADNLGRRMVRIEVPDLPSSARAVRIWRSVNIYGSIEPREAVSVYLLAEHPVGHGHIFNDLTPDGELGDLLDEGRLGPVPQGARAWAWWEGRFWAGGLAEDGARIRASWYGYPGQWPPTEWWPVGSLATGPIVSLTPSPRGLIIGKANGLYIMKRSGDSFQVKMLTEGVGPVSQHGVVVIPDYGVFVLSSAGPVLLRGSLDDDRTTEVVRLDIGASRLWESVTPLAEDIAVYDPVRREVWIQCNGGKTGIVWHIDQGAWSYRDGWSIGSFAYYKDKLWIGSTDVDSGDDYAGIHVVSRAFRTTPGGDEITGVIETVDLESEDLWAISAVEVVGLGFGGVTLSLSMREARRYPFLPISDTLKPQKQDYYDVPTWAFSTWDDNSGTEYWSSYEPAKMRSSVDSSQVFSRGFLISGRVFGLSAIRLDIPPGTLRWRPEER